MKKFIKLLTVKDEYIYVRKNSIVKVWKENNNTTAIMYSSGNTDHIKISLENILKIL